MIGKKKKHPAKITLSNKDSILIQKRNQKLYRQTQSIRIQNHQTSTSGNAEGSSLDKKEKSFIKTNSQTI